MNVAADRVRGLRVEAGEVAVAMAERRVLQRALRRALGVARVDRGALLDPVERDHVGPEVEVLPRAEARRRRLVLQVLDARDRAVRVEGVLGGPVKEEGPRREAVEG